MYGRIVSCGCILQVGAPLHWSHGYLHLIWDHQRFCRIVLCLGEFKKKKKRSFKQLEQSIRVFIGYSKRFHLMQHFTSL